MSITKCDCQKGAGMCDLCYQKFLEHKEKVMAVVCLVTGNLVGSDTWMAGCPCKCVNCQKLVENDPQWNQQLEKK